MAQSLEIGKYFEAEIMQDVHVFAGGKPTVNVTPLENHEISAVQRVYRGAIQQLALRAPNVAADFAKQESAFLKWAAVAKAKFDDKPILAPAEAGTLGVDILIPELYKLEASPSAYQTDSDYKINSWDIDLTAGTAAHLIGTSSTYYKSSNVQDKRTFAVIAKNGILEVGTTPKFNQMKLITESQTRYSPFTCPPLHNIPVEENQAIYQIPTIGQIPLFPDHGVKLSVMPQVSGTSHIELFGLVFYEQGIFNDLTKRT